MLKVAKRVMIGAIIVGLVVLSAGVCFGKITVESLLNNMERTHEEQMKGIEDLTMVQESVGGMMTGFMGETTIYQKRAKVKGRVIYKTRTETKVLGMSVVAIYDGEYNWSVNPVSGNVEKEEVQRDPGQIWKNIDPSQAHYLGEEEIEGEKTHVLKIDDPFKVIGEQPTLPPTGEEDAQDVEASGKLWVSDKTWMVLRWLTTIKTKSIEEGREVITTMRITTDSKDYQKHSTMLVPHKLVINTSVEMDMPGSSEEERREMEMMQEFMGGMGSFEIETTEVQVNTGLSDDLFDPTDL